MKVNPFGSKTGLIFILAVICMFATFSSFFLYFSKIIDLRMAIGLSILTFIVIIGIIARTVYLEGKRRTQWMKS